MAEAARTLRARLEHGPLPRKEVEVLIGKSAARGIHLWLDLVRVPPSGTWERRRADLFGLAETAVPGTAPDPGDAMDHLVRRYLEPPKEQQQATQDVATTPAADPAMAEVEEILSEQLATRVQIQYGKKRGRVVIEFGSVDDLERIVSEIVGSGPGLSPD